MLDPSRHEPDRPPRLARAAAVCGASGKVCPTKRATRLLEAIIEPRDRVVIEEPKALPNLFRLVSNSPAALQGYLGLSSALSKGALPAATRERIGYRTC
jgi:hypothetical protein